MKRKFFINEQEAMKLFKSFGFRVAKMNWYQLRIYPEKSKVIYDWYHTKGSLVKTENGMPIRFGTFGDAEELAEAIRRDTK